MSNIWFTSDTHYGHGNIIRFCNRPYKDIDEMNNALITNFNSVVRVEDTVYHLGDFGFMPPDKLQSIMRRLHGNKFLMLGNHDKQLRRERNAFSKFCHTISDYMEINAGGKQKIILCHYPMLSWNGSGHGSIMLHGHCHGNTNYGHLKNSKILDVGVDVHNYFPISLDEVLRIMSKREAEDYGRNRSMIDDESN